jgi:dTDP-4-dehydrorhamnose reductase
MSNHLPSVIVFTQNEKLSIDNSIKINQSQAELKDDLSYIKLFCDKFVDEIVKSNPIEWFIYDLNILDENEEKMLLFNSYLPRYLYKNYQNLKFIFLSNGNVFGDSNWNESTEIDRHTPTDYYGKTISAGEIYNERIWTLRFELYDKDSVFNNFQGDKVYYGAVDKKYTLITETALQDVVKGLINNYTEIREGTYHIIPKDTQTEYQLMHYNAWNTNSKPYIERSSSSYPINHILKTCKPKETRKLWKFAGYDIIPTFKELFDNV